MCEEHLSCVLCICTWNFPGKNTGVGCHFLLQGIFLTRIEPVSVASPAVADKFFTTVPLGKPRVCWEWATTKNYCFHP